MIKKLYMKFGNDRVFHADQKLSSMIYNPGRCLAILSMI